MSQEQTDQAFVDNERDLTPLTAQVRTDRAVQLQSEEQDDQILDKGGAVKKSTSRGQSFSEHDHKEIGQHLQRVDQGDSLSPPRVNQVNGSRSIEFEDDQTGHDQNAGILPLATVKSHLNKWMEKLPENVRQEFFRIKSFRDVRAQVDAPVERQSKMTGYKRYNVKELQVEEALEGSDDDEDGSSDEELNKYLNGREERCANLNKAMWMKSYGIKFEIPTSHILDARIFTRGDTNHVMQVVKFVVPSELRTKMHVQPPLQFFDDLNEDGNIMVRVLRRGKGASLKLEKDGCVILKDASDMVSCFSQDGTMFAYLVTVDEHDQRYQPAADEPPKVAEFRNAQEIWHAMTANISRSDPLEKKKQQKSKKVLRKLYVVKIDSDEPAQLCQLIREKKFMAEIDVTGEENDPDKFWSADSNVATRVENLQFDLNNRFLVGYGGRKFFKLDLHEAVTESNREQKLQYYEINEFLYDSIMTMTACTSGKLDADIYEKHCKGVKSKNFKPSSEIENSDQKIFIAAKLSKQSKVNVFEYFEDDRKRKADQMKARKSHESRQKATPISFGAIGQSQEIDPDQFIELEINTLLLPQKHIVELDIEDHVDFEKVQVFINHNGRQILFSEDQDRYLIYAEQDGEDKKYSQRRLRHLTKNFNIVFCEEDLYDDGFYLCCCKDYDVNVRLMHTHRDYMKLYLDFFVEVSTTRFYDMHMGVRKEQENGQNMLKTEIVLLGLDHNKFTIDASITSEKEPSEEYWTTSDYEKKAKEAKELKKSFKLEKNDAHNYTEYGAYSMNWPYFSFGDFLGNVYIVDFFDRKIVNRIPLDDKRNTMSDCAHSDLKICCTFISPHQVLYVLVLKDNVYQLYDLDLHAKANSFDVDQYEKRLSTWIRKKFANRDPNQLSLSTGNLDLNEHLRFSKPILEYPERLNGEELEDAFQLFVRDTDSSAQGFRKRTFAFILHGKRLIQWMQSDDKELNKQVRCIEDTVQMRRLRQVSADSFVYAVATENGKGDFPKGGIRQVKIHFMTHEIITLYVEKTIAEKLVTQVYDAARHKVLMLTRAGVKPPDTQTADRRVWRIKLLDVKESKLQINIALKNEHIMGILTSGYYTLVDGHIYHNNNVIKMRYDLLYDTRGKLREDLTENQFFDLYDYVFPLRPGCRISSANLLNSQGAHRFAFISEDTMNQNLPSMIRVTPYLHERRIYIRRIKPGKRYFMTSMEVEQKDREAYNEHLYHHIVKSGTLHDQKKEVDRRKDGIKLRMKQIKERNQIPRFQVIMRMNISDSKYFVYSQNGMLLKRVDFLDIKMKHGDPVCCSDNGRILVFRVRGNHLQYMHTESMKKGTSTLTERGVTRARDKAMIFSIIEMTPTGLAFMRQVNVYNGIRKYFEGLQAGALGEQEESLLSRFKRTREWLYPKDINELLNNLDMRVEVNNKADFCMHITNKKNTESHCQQLIYFEKGNIEAGGSLKDDCDHDHEDLENLKKSNLGRSSLHKHISEHKDSEEKAFRALFDPGECIGGSEVHTHDHAADGDAHADHGAHLDIKGVTLNAKYIIFWTAKQVYAVEIDELDKTSINPKKSTLQIKEPTFEMRENIEKAFPFIDRVRCSNDNGKMIAICIRRENSSRDEDGNIETPGSSTIINWNLDKNFERGQYHVEDPYFVAFDQKGDVFIVHDDKVILSHQKVQLTAFDFDYEDVKQLFDWNAANMDDQVESGVFGVSKGSRFDGSHHHWLLFDEYMSLPYSYMSFVIKDQIERNDGLVQENEFDIEAYNYLFNKRTSFMDSTFTRHDTGEMRRVLENLERLSIYHLGILNYVRRAVYDVQKEDLEAKASSYWNYMGLAHEQAEEGQDKDKIAEGQSPEKQGTQNEEELQTPSPDRGAGRNSNKLVSLTRGISNFSDQAFTAMSTGKKILKGFGGQMLNITEKVVRVDRHLKKLGDILDRSAEPEDTDYDSALHLALSNQAIINVEVILEYMAKVKTRSAANFRDIISRLVEFNNFDTYLAHQLNDNDEMQKYRMIRILKDPLFNCGPRLLCCQERFKKNLEDDMVIQQTTSNTMYFSADRLEGLKINDYYQQYEKYYGYVPCQIQAIQLDWLLEYADKDDPKREEKSHMDRQPLGIKILTAIFQSQNSHKFYNIPAVRALIRFFYRKMTEHEMKFVNAIIQVADMVQIGFQAVIMNYLFFLITDKPDGFAITNDQGEEELVALEDLDWDLKVLKFEKTDFNYFWQMFQIVLSGIQALLIIVRIKNVIMKMRFRMRTLTPQNPVAQCGYTLNQIFEAIIMISRCVIIYYSVIMFVAMTNQRLLSFSELNAFVFSCRIVLVLNLIYALEAVITYSTLFWEKASSFTDLVQEVVAALLPFGVFLAMYLCSFWLAFYMFGQHQVGFDYYKGINQDDMMEGILRDFGWPDCVSNPNLPGCQGEEITIEDRYINQDGNAREDARESVPYHYAFLAFMFVYQMLMGDGQHDYFYEFKTKYTDSWTPIIMYILYIISTFFIMILLLNIIIAIMNDTQLRRSALGRDVIYKNQLAIVLSRIYSFENEVNLHNWQMNHQVKDPDNPIQVYQQKFPRYLTIAYSRSTEGDSEMSDLQTAIEENHKSIRERVNLKMFQLSNSVDTVTKLIEADKKKANEPSA